MNIEINAAQCEVLRRLVEQRLTNLGSEVRHTDTPSVRQELREEREVLRNVLPMLEPVAAP